MRALFLLFFAVLTGVSWADSVKMKCWVVSNGTNTGGHTGESVTNIVNGVNEIYSQVCLKFEIDSVSYTNDTYLANVHLTNSTQWVTLSSIERNTGMLELYFVPSLEGGATAFQTRLGIVVGPSANARTLSHEIGHACGLPDIYVGHRGTSYRVQGQPSKNRMPDDWGWYPPSDSHEQLVKRLLMYGVFSTSKADLSYGDIYGLHYTESGGIKTWFLDQAPIGFGLHGNRHPVSE